MIKTTLVLLCLSLPTLALADPQPVAAPSAATGLPQAAPPLGPVPQVVKVAAAAPAKPKMVCQTDVETGSLVKRARRCGSKETWRKGDEAARQTVLDLAVPSLLSTN